MNKLIIIFIAGAFPILFFSCKKALGPIPFADGIDNSSPVDESSLPDHIKTDYKLVWNDEFNGASLNLSKWNYRLDGTQRTIGYLSHNNVSLNNVGQLVITASKGADGKYYTGMIGTEGIFEQRYGYFECRAMMPNSLGPHAAFWLNSPDNGKTFNPVVDGMEVDIFEYHRKTPNILHFNLHWNGYDANHQTKGLELNYPNIGSGYHTFGVEWTETAYIFYVDGVEKWRSTTPISKRSQYIILSTEITGWGGDPALGTYPDNTLFEYVRIYAKQ